MRNFESEMEKFKIDLSKLLDYKNAQSFASRYKKCSVLEYGTTTYSNSSFSSIADASQNKNKK